MKRANVTVAASFGGIMLVGGLSASAATTPLYWNSSAASQVWSTAADWSTDAAGNTASSVAAGSANDAYFNSTAINANITVGVSGATSVNSLTFNNTGTTLIQKATTGGSVALNLGAGGMTVNSGAGAVTCGGSSNTITVTPQTSQSWTNNSSNALTIYNGMNNVAGTANTLTLAGSGTGGFSFRNTINDGASGGTLGLVINLTGGGSVTTINSATTFTGGVQIKAGTLSERVNGTAHGGISLGDISGNANSTLSLTVGGTELDAITTIAGTTGTQTLTSGQTVAFNNTLTLNNTANAFIITGTGGNLTFSNNVTGNGGISKTGTTILTLSSANDYKGGTALSGGTLNLGNDSALGSGSLTLGIGTTIQSTDTSPRVFTNQLGDLTGAAGTYTFGTATTNTGSLSFTNATSASLSATAVTHTFAVNADTSFTNGFTGATGAALTKTGTATLTLGGTNTYSGLTTVSAGKLVVNGSLAGAATLSTNAALGGSGSIAGLVTASANGATIAPGNSPGTLTVGALSMGTGTVLTYDLNAANHTVGSNINDEIVVNGNLTLDGTINLTNLTDLTNGTYTLLHYTGTLTNNVLNVGSNFGTTWGQSYTIGIDTTGKNVNLTVVPEPGPLALAGVGLVGLLFRRKRAV